MADLVRRLEISEAHNEALVADLCDREAADSQTHTSLASHVAELTVAEADVAELQCGRKDWDRERREMSEEIYALRCEKMMHRSELKEVRRAERRKLVAELRCNAETLTKPPHATDPRRCWEMSAVRRAPNADRTPAAREPAAALRARRPHWRWHIAAPREGRVASHPAQEKAGSAAIAAHHELRII